LVQLQEDQSCTGQQQQSSEDPSSLLLHWILLEMVSLLKHLLGMLSLLKHLPVQLHLSKLSLQPCCPPGCRRTAGRCTAGHLRWCC
jgi:hypothetical protein